MAVEEYRAPGGGGRAADVEAGREAGAEVDEDILGVDAGGDVVGTDEAMDAAALVEAEERPEVIDDLRVRIHG